jgi:ABC-type glycerol-3-phosphate transport system substrate-binding protein
VLDPRLSLAGPLPPAIQLTTVYGAAVIAKSASPEAGAAFIAFMTASQVSGVWTQGGFDPPAQ